MGGTSRRSKGNGCVRKRGDAWEIRYSAGVDEATGKRRLITATVHGAKANAEKELRDRLHKLDRNEHVDPLRITVGEWLETWLSTVKGEVSAKSHERYADIVRGFLIPELGTLKLQTLSAVHVRKVYNKWQTEGRRDGKEGGPSPRTRRHIHRILKSSLAQAAEDQIVLRNPIATMRGLPKVERQEMVTLTADQSAQLLIAIKHSRIYWPVLIALYTGMRRGEILAFRWKHVDLDRGTVSVVQSLEQTREFGLRFKSTKNGKGRVIDLSADFVAELRTLKKQQAEELLALGVRQTGETLVCCRADGQPLQPQSLTHEFAYFARRLMDVPRVRFHDLRHSHATQLLGAVVHPKVVQERLGHSTIAITMDLYSHTVEGMQKAAAEKLNNALGSAISRAAKKADK